MFVLCLMSSVAKVPASPRARQSERRVSVIRTMERSQRARAGTYSALSSVLISPSTSFSSLPTVTHVSQRANDALSKCGNASVMPTYLSFYVQILHKQSGSEHFSGFMDHWRSLSVLVNVNLRSKHIIPRENISLDLLWCCRTCKIWEILIVRFG